MARSLLNAQDKLRAAEERQRKINWINEGAARFNDILKNDAEELEILGDRILKLLVTYLGANQGALFILHGSAEEGFIERIATYAYQKKKFVEEQLPVGTGLIGQCVLEGETIYLKEIPKDFVKITSGLGESTPRNVVIVPLRVRDQVAGAVELASFKFIESFQIEFIERIAENIATILTAKIAADASREKKMPLQALLTQASNGTV